MLAVVSL